MCEIICRQGRSAELVLVLMLMLMLMLMLVLVLVRVRVGGGGGELAVRQCHGGRLLRHRGRAPGAAAAHRV